MKTPVKKSKVAEKMPTKAKSATSTEAAAKPAAKKTSTKTPVVSDESIRQRAYQIYLETGARPGRDLQNWKQAEAELKGGK